MVALALTADRVTMTVSLASAILSPRTAIENVFVVWPGAKVSTAVAPPV